MPPRRSNRRASATPTVPPTPTPQVDPATFQAAVATAMAQLSANGTNRNGHENGNGNGANSSNHGESQGHQRVCSYKDFMNCKPKTFHGDGGVITLTRWFEKTESVFEVCSCPVESKVKYAACTFADAALSWWNGHVKTLTLAVANSMSWEDLKVMMLEEYCPRGEIQKLEQELWNHTMTGSDVTAYTTRFNDLAVLCPGMVTPEDKKVERYIWGLSPQIQGMVISANPTTYDSAKRLAQRLVDYGVRQGIMTPTPGQPKGGDNKRKFWNKKKGQPTQEPAKRQQTVAVHAATVPTTPAPTKQYAGNLPKCNKCNFHHNGACREMHCNNCNRKGHTARFCKAPAQQTTQVTNAGVSQACYGCGETGHFKRECPKAKNKNVGGVGRVLTMGHEEAMNDPAVVTGTFLLNNSYACILFDSGAERSFVSHKFKHLLKQKPQSLKEIFTVEMANGKTESTKDIYIGCTLTLNDHSFQIDLMPVTIRSFDVIIGMDWLSPHHADIMCYERAVRLNLPSNETLVIYGDKPDTNL